ncbi:MAG TPA: NADH-quinone oxidoreductase subunit K [Solirubrobacteraceae bacterium]|jgi:multicomponent Na+:H+ antiporter subunit C|nr:NADH-quinone oxidoreductase subunit K [Solirubrobacteraceae bacterium]
MTLLLALAIGVLFGSGAYLLLKPDLFRIVVGIVLVAHAANVALIASGLGRGQSPIRPLDDGTVSDPLVQAMTITALVIGFAVTALLLCLAYGIYVSSRTVDLDELSHAEARHERELEREEVSV